MRVAMALFQFTFDSHAVVQFDILYLTLTANSLPTFKSLHL